MPPSKILVAASSMAFGQALCSMLGSQNYTLTLVMRRTEALAHLREGHINLGLVQDCLPDLSGLDVCEQFSRHPAAKKIPLILFSHRAVIEQVARNKEACGFVKLPCRPQTLCELMAT